MNQNLLGLWKSYKKSKIVKVLFFLGCCFGSFFVAQEEEKNLAKLFSQLGAKEWESRQQAFSHLLKAKQSPEFERLLQHALSSKDEEIRFFAEKLYSARLFQVPELLKAQVGEILEFYSQLTAEKRLIVLEKVVEKGKALSLGFLILVLENDEHFEVRESAFSQLKELLAKYHVKVLRKELSHYQLPLKMWYFYLQGDFWLKEGNLAQAKEAYLRANQFLTKRLMQRKKKNKSIDFVEEIAHEEINRNLALLFTNEKDTVTARSYYSKLSSSSFLITEILLTSLAEQQESEIWKCFQEQAKSQTPDQLEKLVILCFHLCKDRVLFFKMLATLQELFKENLFFLHYQWSFLEKEGTLAQKKAFLKKYAPKRLQETVPYSLIQFWLAEGSIEENDFSTYVSSPLWLQVLKALQLYQRQGKTAAATIETLKQLSSLLKYNPGLTELVWKLIEKQPLPWWPFLKELPVETVKDRIPQLTPLPNSLDIFWEILEKSDSPELLQAVIEQIKLSKELPEETPLFSFLDHENPYLRNSALSALTKHYQKKTFPYLLKRLQEEKERRVILNLLKALQHFPYTAIEKEIAPFLEDEDEIIRSYAVELLPLEKSLYFLQDPAEKVRIVVIRKLAAGEIKTALPYFFKLLKDPEDSIFEEVLETLINWPQWKDQINPALYQSLVEADPIRTRYLKQALFLMGDKKQLLDFQSDLTHESDEIRIFALEVLGSQAAQEENFRCLEPCLYDSNPNIRRLLAEILKGIEQPQVLEWLKYLLQDSHHLVQFHALQALEFLRKPALEPLIDFGYRKLLYQYPDQTTYQLFWAKRLTQQKNILQALVETEWILRWNQNHIEAHQLLLLLYQKKNDQIAQEKEKQWIYNYYQEKIRETPENPIYLNNLAWSFAEASIELKEALKWINQALALDRDPNFLDTKAEILIKLNRKEEAKKLLQEAYQNSTHHSFKLYLKRRLQELMN